ncbi:tautomerase family protein [Gordonia sp. ABSL1-1]|uniref:tautomerase family protein n=1 Tax=Gordonia sp. ABSL1-1 TaxID=3053923 RepID=UPI0025746EA2|nr:tautomerase family protein [Gordonia sp. ABSL1-1]MDL9937205.1 tautomerase family protein [Gordonia sp. ABSL1-1]
MPSTQIEVRRSYGRENEVAILDAVHDALVVAFAIPPEDRHVRLVVHEPHRFAVPPTLTTSDAYTLVTVDCFAGRSVDAKRALYRAVVGRLGELGIPGDHVTVVVRDIDTASWGIRGGQAACDIDLGFDINV